MKKLLKTVVPTVFLLSTHLAYADSGEFKRWSVSAGWLHVMPQGKANTFNINTAAKEGTVSSVGSISKDGFLDSIDPDAPHRLGGTQKDKASTILNGALGSVLLDANGNVKSNYTGKATINGLEQWNDNAGLEADDVDTLGLTLNYYVNDNVSLQLIGGIPPKVDINGKGKVVAPFSGTATPSGLASAIGQLDLLKDIPITDLGAHGKAASARAWTPALTAQYHFGKSGVNKLRPYLGAGIVYGHFDKIKLNGGVEQDLVNAGHMIQNVLDGQAGSALVNSGSSSADPHVKVDTDDAFGAVLTAGFTYDFNDRWFSTMSLTYMPNFNNKATISVTDSKTGKELIHATTKVDLDPLITYVGVGYRF
ncbi:MAG: OmpW family protein [Acinetobacter sp.]|uniref:OmpW/AlkL family protein n=1 Tax=Acinetobacter sp. TaxID=472 RepID=UPI000DB4370D|nr:OmpW family outer membrane protein [Acinetobacter sp.]PZT85160.1 MAG: OmpW family protein [Acinetobacter sp.]